MMIPHQWRLTVLFCLLLGWCWAVPAAGQASDPLPGWRDGSNKRAILAFVEAVSTRGGAGFVPREQRIATFDMDGTLIVEKPMPMVLAFARQYLADIARANPKLDLQPYKASREQDEAYLDSHPLQVLTTAHMGLTQTDYQQRASRFAGEWKHPRFGRPPKELFYRPMLELLAHLREKGFRVFILSGSPQGFVRGIAKPVTGLPYSHLLGTQLALSYHAGELLRTGAFRNLGAAAAGKPLFIEYHIGERPILAFGNAAVDQQMLEYAAGHTRRRHLSLWLSHDDAQREYVYPSHVRGQAGWLEVSLKRDFALLFDKP